MSCNCTGACRRPPYTCGGLSSQWTWDGLIRIEPEKVQPANPPASPTPFLLGLVVGCVVGGDFVWIIGQLFNG